MAYQLLTACKIFDAQTIGAWCAMVLGQDPLPASQRCEGLPPAIDPVFRRALAKSSSDRYHSCGEFVSDLEDVLLRQNTPSIANGANAGTEARPRSAAVPAAPEETIRTASEERARWPLRTVAICVVGGLTLTACGIAVKYLIDWKLSPPVTNQPKKPPKEPSDPSKERSVPVIADFSASRVALKSGESLELRWDVRDAADVSIDGVGSALPIQGTRIVHPDASKTYVLKASGGGGSIQRSIAVSVTLEPLIHSFSASRQAIQSGQPTLLQWNVTGATRISLEGIGELGLEQTNRPVCPTTSKTYVLSAIGPGGTVHKSVDVAVTIPLGQNVKLSQFVADPATIVRGQVSVLRWAVENASAVWIEPDIGQVEACGVLKVQPQVTTQYRLAYQNDRGTMRSKPVVVKVE
jgi:hypothetical protein